MRLAVLAKPAQEFVGVSPPFRRDLVVVPLEEPVHQYREFVDRQNDRLLTRGQRREQCVTPRAPASSIDPGAQLDPEFADSQLVDSINRGGRGLGYPVLDADP